jgi:hypothetical protein
LSPERREVAKRLTRKALDEDDYEYYDEDGSGQA